MNILREQGGEYTLWETPNFHFPAPFNVLELRLVRFSGVCEGGREGEEEGDQVHK